MFKPFYYNNIFDNLLNWKKLYCNCCDEKLQMMSCELLSEYISGISFLWLLGDLIQNSLLRSYQAEKKKFVFPENLE